MTIASNAKTRVFVSASTTIPSNLTGFEALTWIEVGSIEDAGAISGDSASEIKVEMLGNARVQKFKGARDGGDMKIVCGYDAADLGQNALRTAAKDDFNRPIKISLNDAPNATGTGSEFFFSALIMSAEVELKTSKDIIKQNFSLSVNSDVLSVPAAAGA